MNLEQVISKLENDIINTTSKRNRAEIIYNWVQQNISYDYDRQEKVRQGIPLSPLTPDELLYRRKGICCDQAILYAVIGRRLRLNVNYASVEMDDLNHAINIVETEKGLIQVDTTNGIFEAEYSNYRVKHSDLIQSFLGFDPVLLPVPFHLRKSVQKRALVIAGIATAFLGAYFVPKMRSDVKDIYTSNSVRFVTKNGNLEFTFDPEAKSLVKEALFYKEAMHGNTENENLLIPYVQADLDGDNHFTKEEAKDARDRARSDYLKSLR